MRKFIVFIALISTLGFTFQLVKEFSLASLLALLASLIVFLTALANLMSDKKKQPSVNQSIGNNSQGVQVGGNLTINNKDEK